ncbi:Hypothetical protein CFH99_0140 [Nocardioides aromaticivorans]|uniref:Uncharacterized protein n=1 Tax=Nocardioides aromaticivorans TaxID=200618 RepID=A0ABX7PSC1_9ACTN|nr:hypothetical protein [Nocardioides aromaticivorans]QSR28904.1 Hypothetical protein CFH99_0140 [Nocardioides aromaticivorans]
MRSKVLGLAAAAITAGALTFVPSVPAGAVGGIDGGNISGSGDVPNSVDVAAFGSGDAVAAWARPVPGGTKVYAAIATNGVWGAPKAVTAAAVTDAHDVHAVANDAGDLAVVWNQTTGGEHKVRGSRYLPNGTWDGSTLLSPAVDIETVTGIGAGIDGAGRVHVAYQSEDADIETARATFWKKDAAPQFTDFGANSFKPSIDVNPAGAALLSYFKFTNGGSIFVTRRNASLGWLGPKAVAWPDKTTDESVVGLADDGRGAVLIGGLEDAKARAVVSKVGTSGSLGAVNVLSSGNTAIHRDLAVSPNGTLQASWSTYENSSYVIRQAVAKPDEGFGTSGLADPSTVTYQPHVGLIGDRRNQVVVHDDADALTLRHRTNPILPFSTYAAGTQDSGAFAADMDRDGNAVVVGVRENGLSSFVNADWLDVTGPRADVTAPGPQVTSKAFDVTWSATDSLAGLKSSDVIASSAAWNSGTFSDPEVVGSNLVSGPLHVSGGLGRTYCYEVQSEDLVENIGQRSARRCTSVPLDDTALLGSGWSRAAKSGQFNGTWTTTSTKGRTLTRAGIKAKRLALVANRVPNGGLVEVRWNGTLLKKVSLKGAAATKKVYPIVTWAGLHTGTLTIKVISASGRPVRIDGLVVAK